MDIHGWNFYRDDNDPSPELPEDQHGTAVAGVAVAAHNNIGRPAFAYGCHSCRLKVVVEAIGPLTARWLKRYIMPPEGVATVRTSGAERMFICISLSFPQSSVVDDAWSGRQSMAGEARVVPSLPLRATTPAMETHARAPCRLAHWKDPALSSLVSEYSKDVSSSDGEDLIKIDNVALLGVTE